MTRKTTLIEIAYATIRADLLSCRLLPGARLKIGDLSARVSVGPGGVREALSRLVAEDLVVVEPLKGFRAAPLSCSGSSDLIAARVEIESVCFELSIRNGDESWMGALKGAYAELSRPSNRVSPTSDAAWEGAHTRFHDALVAGCGNRTLLQIRSQLYEQSQRYRNLVKRLAPQTRNLPAEHRLLFEAAAGRDVAQGVSLIRNHILLTRQAILDAMESQEWTSCVAAQSIATSVASVDAKAGRAPSRRGSASAHKSGAAQRQAAGV